MDQTLLEGNKDNDGRQEVDDDEALAKGLARENTDRSMAPLQLSLACYQLSLAEVRCLLLTYRAKDMLWYLYFCSAAAEEVVAPMSRLPGFYSELWVRYFNTHVTASWTS